MTRRTTLLTLTLAVALPACGGGGGSSPPRQRSAPQFLLADVELPLAARSGALELALAADGDTPVMAQLDLVFDPAQIELQTPVEAIAALPDLDAGLVEAGRMRVVFGDASSARTPARLPTGALLRLPFTVAATATPGTTRVRAVDAIASDATGGPAPISAEGASATVTRR